MCYLCRYHGLGCPTKVLIHRVTLVTYFHVFPLVHTSDTNNNKDESSSGFVVTGGSDTISPTHTLSKREGSTC